MTAQLLPNIVQKFMDNNGVPLAGGFLYSYQAGTTTPLATYTDETAGTPNTNPVVLDSTGSASVWLGSSAYKFVLKDVNNNVIRTVDNVSIINPASIDNTKIASSVAGAALLQNGGGSLDVQVDNVTMQITSNQLKVKTLTADSFPVTSKLEIVTKMVRDNSIPGLLQQIPQYEWSSPTLLTSPGTLPPNGNVARWSPNGEFLAVGSSSSPFIDIYQKSQDTLTKLADPGTLPAGLVTDLSWSPCGDFLAVGHKITPFITIYQRTGNVFTKISNPSTLPNLGAPVILAVGVNFSPNSDFLLVPISGTSSSHKLFIYERNGTTFTEISGTSGLTVTNYGNIYNAPASSSWLYDSSLLALINSTSGGVDVFTRADGVFTSITGPVISLFTLNGISFSPDGKFLAVISQVSPFIAIYSVTNNTFSVLSAPATLPPDIANCLSWSANSEYLAIGHNTTPFMTIYSVSGTTFTKIANPSVLPAAAVLGIDFSQTKQYLATAGGTTPFVQVYKTASTLPSNALLWTRGVPNV